MPIDTRELMKQVGKIKMITTRLVNEHLSGEYHSVFKGQGIEFDEVREYVPGDELRLIERKGLFLPKLRQWGKFFLPYAHDPKGRSPRSELNLMIGRSIESDINTWKLPHDPGETLDRQCDCSALFYLCLDPASHSKIQIRRGQRNLIFFGLNQDIAQDWHGCL